MAKMRLAKFEGLPGHTFYSHLKQTEWRYNDQAFGKPKPLLRYIRENPPGHDP